MKFATNCNTTFNLQVGNKLIEVWMCVCVCECVCVCVCVCVSE